jgi:hypothetical protein
VKAIPTVARGWRREETFTKGNPASGVAQEALGGGCIRATPGDTLKLVKLLK